MTANVTQGEFPHGPDDDMEITKITETIEKNESRKRPADEKLEDRAHKKTLSSEAIKKLESDLQEVGFEEEALIFNYIQDYDSDQVVKEYIDTAILLKIVPEIENTAEVKSWLKESSVNEVNKETKEAVANFLSFYFQSKYFQSNMKEATGNAIDLIQIQAKVMVPCFQLVPSSYLTKCTEAKRSLAYQLQGLSFEASQFTTDLLILRSLNAIRAELQKHSETVCKTDILHHFSTLFLKTQMEFISTYNIKNIDWSTKQGKVKHIEPKWRKSNEDPPTLLHNKYAQGLVKRIKQNSESFDPKVVKSEYESFVNNGKNWIEKMKSSSTGAGNTNANFSFEKVPHSNQPFMPPKRNYRRANSANNYPQNTSSAPKLFKKAARKVFNPPNSNSRPNPNTSTSEFVSFKSVLDKID